MTTICIKMCALAFNFLKCVHSAILKIVEGDSALGKQRPYHSYEKFVEKLEIEISTIVDEEGGGEEQETQVPCRSFCRFQCSVQPLPPTEAMS